MTRGVVQILSFMMLFMVGFYPARGASYVGDDPQQDSLPIARAIYLTTEGQKRLQIYDDYQAAESLFRQAIVADSTLSSPHYLLSQLYAATTPQVDSVLKYTRNAFMLDSLNKWYNDSYAQALAVTGDYTQARRLYTKAIERSPQELNGYIMVAMILSRTSQPLAAIAILDSAQMRSGQNSYISSMKRELLLSTGQHQRAVVEARELVDMEPSAIEHRLILAELLAATAQDSLASVEYSAALAIDSTSLPLLNSISRHQLDRGNYMGYLSTLKKIFASPLESLDSKMATFRRITSDKQFYGRYFFAINELATLLSVQYPLDDSVTELYATHLIAGGDLELALELYKRHTHNESPNYNFYKAVIDIESYKQRADSVELYSTRAIAQFPDREELRLSLANFYSYTKRYDEAIDGYRSVLRMDLSDSLKSVVLGFVGDNYHQKSLDKPVDGLAHRRIMRKAYRNYRKALALDGNNAMVLNNYAYFLSLEQRQLGEALDMAGRAVALSNNNPTYMDTYAWVLFELGRYDEAKSIMRQVIALDTSQSADIQFHYAEILAALGETFMAEVYYDKALKLGYSPEVITRRKETLK